MGGAAHGFVAVVARMKRRMSGSMPRMHILSMTTRGCLHRGWRHENASCHGLGMRGRRSSCQAMRLARIVSDGC